MKAENKQLLVPKSADVSGIDHGHQVLTADEAAQFLRVNKMEVYNLCRQNAIPFRRIGKRYVRFWKDDLVKFMHNED